MNKVLSIVFMSIFSVNSFSDDTRNLSFGLGTDQGGFGWKYTVNDRESRFYGSLGLYTYGSSNGFNLGYGLGWENLVGSGRNNTLGIFLGSVSGEGRNEERTSYHGAALTYNYYFKGFTKSTYVMGVDLKYGISSNSHSYFKENISQVSAKVAYQW